jgi:hypothetical protein
MKCPHCLIAFSPNWDATVLLFDAGDIKDVRERFDY